MNKILNILTITILNTFICHAQLHLNVSNENNLYNNIFELVSTELNIDTVKNIYVSYANFNPEITNEFGAVSYTKGIYNINIQKNMNKHDVIVTLIHELVHIKQLNEKRLWLGKCCNWFEGVTYTNAIAYNDRPYEKEALNMALELYLKFYKKIN